MERSVWAGLLRADPGDERVIECTLCSGAARLTSIEVPELAHLS
jgi:hypothetical protein